MPNPGLLPTKSEWREQHEIVAKAVKRLRRKGIDADGQVLGTRKSTKRILGEADKEGCDAIVMSADPDRNRIIGDMLWTQEPQRVRRRSKLPVFLVVE
jgi:nucleotide-binding universal stress UspA family protein